MWGVNMDGASELQERLQQKEACLIRFEQVTQQMLDCPIEQLEGLVLERQRQIDRVNQLDQEIDNLCQQADEVALLQDVLQGRADVGRIPDHLKIVYQLVLRIRTVLSRVQESDLQAGIRLRIEQERILDRIKATNQGTRAKAARFFSTSNVTNRSSHLGNA